MTDPKAWDFLGSLLWVLLIGLVLWHNRGALAAITAALVARLRAGAPVKIASFELGSLPYVTANAPQRRLKGLVSIEDDDGTFHASREHFKTTHRNLFLVHKVAPSEDPEQLYDIVIYLVPSLKHGSLASVLAVDYYFGRYWGNKVFRSIDRANSFLISTSAYAPFSCSARINFTDGEQMFLHRYVDFEMGQLPPGTFRHADA